MRETLTEEKIIYYIAKDPDVLERAYFSSMRDLCRRYVQISSDTLEWNRLQNEIILANSIPGKSEEKFRQAEDIIIRIGFFKCWSVRKKIVRIIRQAFIR